jgi:hypothetical protein
MVALSLFYLLSCFAQLYRIVALVYDRPSKSNAVSAPSWLPMFVILQLSKKNVMRAVSYSTLAATLVTSVFPEYRLLRCLCALLYTCYCIPEFCVTGHHGCFGAMYTNWALTLLPPSWYARSAFLIFVHLYFASGYMKIAVGGLNGWTSPQTFRGYLRFFLPGGYLSFLPPLMPSVSYFILRHDLLLRAVAVTTLLFECVLVPSCLFVPPHLMHWMFYVVCLFYVGIGIVQSYLVGMSFVSNVPLAWLALCYADEFPAIGTSDWLLTVAFAAAPLLIGVARGFPDNVWPIDNLALYAWSGTQFEWLLDICSADIRLVLLPHGRYKHANDIVGASVLKSGSGHRVMPGEHAVYDAFMFLVGPTNVYPGVVSILKEQVFWRDFEKTKGTEKSIMMKNVTARLEDWLSRQTQFHDFQGRKLVGARFVRVDRNKEIVAEVIG